MRYSVERIVCRYVEECQRTRDWVEELGNDEEEKWTKKLKKRKRARDKAKDVGKKRKQD